MELRFRELWFSGTASSPGSGVGRRAVDCIVAAIVVCRSSGIARGVLNRWRVCECKDVDALSSRRKDPR